MKENNHFADLSGVRNNTIQSEKERLDGIRKIARERHKLLFTYYNPLITNVLRELDEAMGWNAGFTNHIEQEQLTDPVDHADSARWALQWELKNSKSGGIDHYEVRVGWSCFYVPAGYNNGIDESSISVAYDYHPNYATSKDFREEFIMKEGVEFHQQNHENLVKALRSVVQNGEAYVGKALK